MIALSFILESRRFSTIFAADSAGLRAMALLFSIDTYTPAASLYCRDDYAADAAAVYAPDRLICRLLLSLCLIHYVVSIVSLLPRRLLRSPRRYILPPCLYCVSAIFIILRHFITGYAIYASFSPRSLLCFVITVAADFATMLMPLMREDAISPLHYAFAAAAAARHIDDDIAASMMMF